MRNTVIFGVHLPMSKFQRKSDSYQNQAGHRWLAPVILATQEAEVRRITV
jgi:hypothetical protein